MTSCGSSKTPLHGGSPVTGNEHPTTTEESTVELKELKPSEITRECSASEVSLIKNNDQLIQKSNEAVDSIKGKKDDKVIASSTEAVRSCDVVTAQINSSGACRITKKSVVNPDKPVVSFYDAYRVHQKCSKAETYLVKNNARPTKGETTVVDTQPAPSPVTPAPSQPDPVSPIPPVDTSAALRQCSGDEFSNLSEMVKSLDLATKQVDRLGSKADWKYESDAIANSALAAKACENLIAYHDQSPCEKSIQQDDGSKILRQYTGATLRQRCEKARTYFYEFVQNKTTLNFKNADLYVDVSDFENKVFEMDHVYESKLCRIENKSGATLDYTGRDLVLVKDSRGFEAKMMVLETQEGLLIQCYGLNIDGAFSKREIVKVLKDEGTDLPLVYKLK